jgi:hypothetical protein
MKKNIKKKWNKTIIYSHLNSNLKGFFTLSTEMVHSTRSSADTIQNIAHQMAVVCQNSEGDFLQGMIFVKYIHDNYRKREPRL